MPEEKIYKKITELKNWDKNPRAIKAEDFERLKKQIVEFGQYKPLIATPEGEVLGGNMRLKAYEALGIEDIWVSIVEPKNEAEKIKYALSDNDKAGYYLQEDLAEIVTNFKDDIDLTVFNVDLGKSVSLSSLLADLGPGNTEVDVNDLGDKLDSYLNGTIKQIVLYFTNDEYEGVIKKFTDILSENKFQSNTEVVVFLLDFYEKNRSPKI